MELLGSAYLYTLATLAMTFAGFCAIVIVLRQTTGHDISGFHLVLTRLYLESGLFSAAFCMLPPLLALCGLTETAVWRISSAIIATVFLCFGATYPMRRAAIMAGPVPCARWMPIVSVSMLVVVALVSNAAGFPHRPTIGPIAVAATWTLGCGATVFVLALNAVWTDTAETETDR
ncbi:hypothetical protein AC629_16235 [Bradyrhizobium sp. NAS80.1]|uniref:hypothetical protein n=1 Tax=Bradyrhizobium sp. NAS80.1 TaxID=1680159 RepID=UPI00095D2A0B|nr:hypothetical protein [Bradyrhizobium sp. NAS80.1]OKO86620.1 hypothetical protein AC629_16235 [Bradyrhizobium sp. NAS80.1]